MGTKLVIAVPTVVLIVLSISCAVVGGEVPVGVKKRRLGRIPGYLNWRFDKRT